jgi:hypothetical protein
VDFVVGHSILVAEEVPLPSVLADNSLLAAAAAEDHNLHFSKNKTRKSYINSTKLCMLKHKHTEHKYFFSKLKM